MPAEAPLCPGPAQRRAGAEAPRKEEHSSGHVNKRPGTLFTSQNQLPPCPHLQDRIQTLRAGKGEEPETPLPSYLVSLFLLADRCYRLGIRFPSHMQSTLKQERHINQLAGVSAQDPRPGGAEQWALRKWPLGRAPADVQSTQTRRHGHTTLPPRHSSVVYRLTWGGAPAVAHSTSLGRALLGVPGGEAPLQTLHSSERGSPLTCMGPCAFPPTPVSNIHHWPSSSKYMCALCQGPSHREAAADKKCTSPAGPSQQV